MSNLLDKSSIILTPTAYNNGEALCVKPSDGSGDFQFSRNSAATRVNAQGLVENVQSLGSELVTNGDFATDSDWSKGTGWSISGGSANCDGTQTSSTVMVQSSVTNTNTNVKVSFTISGYVSGLIRVRNSGGFAGTYVSGNGTYVFYTNTGIATNIVLDADADFIGSIDNVSVKEVIDNTNLPRISYENFSFDGSGNIIPDSGCGSWLFEPQSTNVITQSELFSDAIWNDIDVSLESGYLAPDGTNSAYKVTSTGTQSHLYTGAVGGAIGKHKSIYARTLSGTGTVNLCNHNSDTNALFTITEQWQRFDISHSGIDLFYAVDFRGAGATLSDVIIWGAQVEALSYATSYIPTDGSTVTRNQDVCTGGGSLATINSTSGTLYAEIAALADDETNREITLSDGTTTNYVLIRFNSGGSNRIYTRVDVGGAIQYFDLEFSIDITNTTKIAIRYQDNNFATFINGSKVKSQLSGIAFGANTLTELSFDNGSGGANFFGKTKCVAVFPYLSDAELTELTTI